MILRRVFRIIEDNQWLVIEVKGHKERITAIAREYAKSPEGTLVVSPDNLSRTEINQRIHAELQSRGIVGKEDHSVQTLVPRQGMTGADRSWAQQYQMNVSARTRPVVSGIITSVINRAIGP